MKPTIAPAVAKDTAAQTKLGLLTIGRKRPGFDQPWNETMRKRADEAFKACGFAITTSDVPVVDEQTTRAAIARIKAAGCETIVVLQPSLGNGQLVLTVSQEWDGPIVLWATPERAESEKVSSCSLVATHLWASALRQVNRPYELVYGDPADNATRDVLRRAVAICRTTKILQHTKAGVVGGHAPGFLNMAVDLVVLRERLGVQLQTLSLPMFLDRVRAIDEKRAAEDVARVNAAKIPFGTATPDDVAMNSRIYLAIHDLMAEEALDAIAVQCWPEMPNMLGQWPYLAFSRMNDEGIPVALEGDVDGALTLLLGNHLNAGVGYISDWLEHDEHTVHFWHPGNAALQWMNAVGSPQGPSFGKHFNIERPMVVDGPLKQNIPVTITRLWSCDGKYHLTAVEGRSIPPRRKVTGNQMLVEIPDRDCRQWFEDICHAGLPHHVVLFSGHHRETFKRFARVANLEWMA